LAEEVGEAFAVCEEGGMGSHERRALAFISLKVLAGIGAGYQLSRFERGGEGAAQAVLGPRDKPGAMGKFGFLGI